MGGWGAPQKEDHWEAKGVLKLYTLAEGGMKSDPNWLWDLGSVTSPPWASRLPCSLLDRVPHTVGVQVKGGTPPSG